MIKEESIEAIMLPREDKYAALGDIVRESPLFACLDRASLLYSIIKREHEQSTYIGHGVMIAHGRLRNLDKTRIAFALSDEGITGDREPIHVVFAIASPENAPNAYLKSISSLLSWVHNNDFREHLKHKDYSDSSVKLFCKMFKDQNFVKYSETH